MDVAYFPRLPIRTRRRQSISHQLGVVRNSQATESNRAILCQFVGVQQFAWFFFQIARDIKDALVLQSGVAGNEIALLLLKWDTKFFVVPQFRDPLLNRIALGNRAQKIKRDFVFRLNPGARLQRIRILEPAIGVGDFGPVIIIHLVAFARIRIPKSTFVFSKREAEGDKKNKKRDAFHKRSRHGNVAHSKVETPIKSNQETWISISDFRFRHSAVRIPIRNSPCGGSRVGRNPEAPIRLNQESGKIIRNAPRFRFPRSALRVPPLASCCLFSECHCRGISIDFFTRAKPTAIGNLVKMSFWITEYTDHGLGQPQRREQAAWNILLSLIWQLP